MNQLLSYVPPVLWDVLEFQLLTEAAQVAFDRLSKETGSLLGSSFSMTQTRWAFSDMKRCWDCCPEPVTHWKHGGFG